MYPRHLDRPTAAYQPGRQFNHRLHLSIEFPVEQNNYFTFAGISYKHDYRTALVCKYMSSFVCTFVNSRRFLRNNNDDSVDKFKSAHHRDQKSIKNHYFKSENAPPPQRREYTNVTRAHSCCIIGNDLYRHRRQSANSSRPSVLHEKTIKYSPPARSPREYNSARSPKPDLPAFFKETHRLTSLVPGR